MQANINLSESSETGLKLIETIGNINNLKCKNKEQQIELAIKIAVVFIKSVDEDTMKELTGLSKSI